MTPPPTEPGPSLSPVEAVERALADLGICDEGCANGCNVSAARAALPALKRMARERDEARALLCKAGEAMEQGIASLIEMDLRIEGDWGRCHNYEQMEAGDEWDPAIPKLRAALAKIREQDV